MSDTEDKPAWVAALRRQYSRNLSITHSAEGDVPHLRIAIPGGQQRGGDISLSAVVDEPCVIVDVTRLRHCTIRDTPANLTLRIVGGGHQALGLTLANSVQGPVELEGVADGILLTVERGAKTDISVTGGVVGPQGDAMDHPLTLAGGELGSGTYDVVRASGKAAFASDRRSTLTIMELALLQDSALEFHQNGGTLNISRLYSQQGKHTLELSAPNAQEKSRSVSLNLESVESARVAGGAEVEVTLNDLVADATFSGKLKVVVARSHAIDGLSFEKSDSWYPRLLARPGSVVTGIEGAVVIQEAEEATLVGAGKGFRIIKVESVRRGSSSDYFKDAYIRNFRVTPGLRGHALLSYMDAAHQVEPSTADLPGWELRFRPTSSAGRVDRRNAEFTRKLSELADTKGASGSVRTKVGWCNQRLRHEATSGWVERRALDGYRCLGYGERAGPPLITWLVLSLVFTLLLWWLGHATVCNLGDFLALWANRAASPVGAILGTGTAAEDSAWLYLVRAMVAIPLVVAALCVRKYVRAGK